MVIHVDKIFCALGIQARSNVVIWGAGIRGKRVLSSLQSIRKVTETTWKKIYFCDMDVSKQGHSVHGELCLSPDQLESLSDLVIIFSVAECEEECNRLRKKFQGKAVVLGEEFVDMLDYLPPAHGYNEFFHLGHFYSLYPNLMEMENLKLNNSNKSIEDIDFNEDEQLEYLQKMVCLYDSLPDWVKVLEENENSKYRYRFLNAAFSPGDSVGLHCMLRILKPRKMIEVGSGWTSAVTLDTNEYYLENQVELTFIEPFPERLKSLLKSKDRVNLMECKLQDIPLEYFKQLEDGDILFIDSTHVSKLGSDVNYLFFEILPTLQKGVYIHFHDIFYPFEYPEEWTKKGMVWNELYLLRAFLMNNPFYKIIFFQNMMEQRHPDMFMEKWPLKDLPIHGGSLWLKKI